MKNNRKYTKAMQAFQVWSDEHDLLVDLLLEGNWAEYRVRSPKVTYLLKSAIRAMEDV